MSGLALLGLVVFVGAFLVVIVVRSVAARAIRHANEPQAGVPTGAALGRELLEERGLGVVTIVEADVDAYRAIPREIQLADGRFDHGSVASCAIVALEVAHAAQHERGSVSWQRWWVVSGHTLWAGPVLFAALALELVVSSPLLILVCLACLAVLSISGALSLRVERTAIREARGMLADSSSAHVDGHQIDRVLRWAGRAYVAESVFDPGFLDRSMEPYRGPSL